MEGDRCDLKTLCRLKKQYECILYIDEAHSLGMLGERGLGLAEEEGLISEVDLLVFPMGKALASQGAFLICERAVKDYLVNFSRPMIFSTAIPPVSVAWSRFVMKTMIGWKKRRQWVSECADWLREGIRRAGLATTGDTHIVPIILGENARAVEASCRFRQNGLWAGAIRHPTVPRGEARLRISLCADMNREDIERIIRSL